MVISASESMILCPEVKFCYPEIWLFDKYTNDFTLIIADMQFGLRIGNIANANAPGAIF